MTKDDGSAAMDFALVAALISLAFAGLLGLGLAQHARSVLTDCASAAARHGALAGHEPEDGAERARALVAAALPGLELDAVRARYGDHLGYRVVQVELDAEVPLLGALGITGLTASGRAFAEDQP